MLNKILKLLLVFCFSLTLSLAADVTVDPDATADNVTVFSTLIDAISALIDSSGQLIDSINSVTLNNSNTSQPQYFPSITITGDSSSGIDIFYTDAPNTISDSSICSSLPLLVLANQSYLSLSGLGYFSITGLAIQFGNVEAFNSLTNVGNFTVSNYCFNSTTDPSSAISEFNSFQITSASTISFLNGVYLFDQTKNININKAQNVTVDSIVFTIPTNTQDLYQFGFYVDNIGFSGTSVTVSNAIIECNSISMVTATLIVTTSVDTVNFSSINITSCDFTLSGSQFYGATFSSVITTTLVIQDVLAQNLSFGAVYDNMFIYTYEIISASLENIYINGMSIQGAEGTFNQFFYISPQTDQSLNFIASNWTVMNVTITDDNSLILISDTSVPQGSSFEISNFQITNCSLNTAGTLITHTISASADDSVDANLTIVNLNAIQITQAQVTSGNFFEFTMSGLQFTPAIEVYQIRLNNTIITDSSMNQADFFLVEGLLLQVENMVFTDITLSASSLFSSENVPSSLFLMNSTFDTINLLATSSIVSYTYSDQRIQAIEDSFNNNNDSVFAETRPLIVAFCSFNNIQAQSSSISLTAENPMISISDNYFTNSDLNEVFFQLGGYVNMVTDQSSFFGDDDSSSNVLSADTLFSDFDLAESIMFQNLSEIQALFDSYRSIVSNYDPQNSVYFILVQNNCIDTITVSSGESLISISNFEINNGSIQTYNNIITNLDLLSSSSFYLFQAEFTSRFVFGAFSMSQVSMAAYVFAVSSDVLQNLVIDQNSFYNNDQLGSFLIEGTTCYQITIQNMLAQYLTLNAVFLSISCQAINGQITISGLDIQDISESVISTIFDPVNFISFSVDNSDSSSIGQIFFQDSTFEGITFIRQDGYAKRVFANTIFSLLTIGCSISFQNVTFDTMSIIPSGSMIMVSAPSLSIENSSLSNFTYSNPAGALDLVLQSITVLGTTFANNVGLIQDGAGVIGLSNPDNQGSTVNLVIENCTFDGNSAAFGTILYLDLTSINLTLTGSFFSNNQLSSNGGLLFLSQILDSQIFFDSNQFSVDQNYQSGDPNLTIISIQDGSNIIVQINNTELEVSGDMPGVFIGLVGNQDIQVNINTLGYVVPSSSATTAFYSSFGILYSDNVQATVTDISVLNAIIIGSIPLFEINCVFGDSVPRVWELTITDSNFGQLNLGRSLILIESSESTAAPLDNLTILIQNSNFSDIIWDEIDAGIVRSLTSFIGKYESEQSYAITIINCQFTNLNISSPGSIFSGYEPIFGCSVLLLIENNFDTINSIGYGAIASIYPFTEQVSLDNSVAADISQDTSPNSTILCINNSFTTVAAVSGGIIYAIINQLNTNTSNNNSNSSFQSSNGVSITIINSTSMNISVNEEGGVIYFGSVYTNSNTNVGGTARRILTTQNNYSGYITVLNSSFQNLEAQDGSFLYEDTVNNTLSLLMQNNVVQNSITISRGGVFYLLQPSISIDGNTFVDCSAGIAGNILFSLSGQINLTNFSSNNVISGSNNNSSHYGYSFAPTNLKIDIISLVSNQILQLENYQNLSSNPIVPDFTTYSLSEYQINFTLIYVVEQGFEVVPDESSQEASMIVTFIPLDDGKVQTHYGNDCPNSICSITASEIQLTGNAGDLILVNATYISAIYTQFQQFQIRLRSCLPGEINHTDTKECVECNPGTYSVNLNDSECHDCPVGAICNGGSNITIKEGFYRSAVSTDLYVLDCDDDGSRCLGGYNYTCAEAYEGPLCLQCKLQDFYFPSGNNDCSQCASENRLIALGTLLLIGALAYQIAMIVVTFKENKKAHKEYESKGGPKEVEPGALLVIFSTFAQICSIIASFDVGTVSYLLNVSVSIGNPNSQVIFSLKCLYYIHVPDAEGSLIFQMMFYVFSPILKIIVALIFQVIWNTLRKNKSSHTKKDLMVRVGAVATAIIILEQPGIIGILCSYLSCVQLDPNINEYYITKYNSFQCYTPTYNYILKILVIPGLLFWGVIIPMGALIIMCRKRKILYKSESIRLVLGNLYNNYIEKAYYWGILLMIIKIIISIINSLISSQSLKGLIFMILFHIYYVFLKKKHPGNHKYLNKAEGYCCIAYMGVLTLVFFKIATDNSLIQLMCNLGILFICIFAGGYMLTHIFWIQLVKIIELYHRIRIRLMTQKILKETLSHLAEYHTEKNDRPVQWNKFSVTLNRQDIVAQRRNAISLDLSPRLRQTEKHELERIEANNNKRMEIIRSKKEQFYAKFKRTFEFSRTSRDNVISIERRQNSSESIPIGFKDSFPEKRSQNESSSKLDLNFSEIDIETPMNRFKLVESSESQTINILTSSKKSIFSQKDNV